MEIESTRFGTIDVDDDRIITFAHGLLGFPRHSRYALIQTGADNYFFWLQAVDEPTLAFVVTDPAIFFKDYEVPLREETRQELLAADEPAAATLSSAVSLAGGRGGARSPFQVFVICNKVGEWLTGNLLGPIVVNTTNRLASQVVLTEKKWTTRQPLLKIEPEVALARSA